MAQLVIGISGMIALFTGWALVWQVIFGQFDGVWGQKKSRGNLVIAFVASVVVCYVLVNG